MVGHGVQTRARSTKVVGTGSNECMVSSVGDVLCGGIEARGSTRLKALLLAPASISEAIPSFHFVDVHIKHS